MSESKKICKFCVHAKPTEQPSGRSNFVLCERESTPLPNYCTCEFFEELKPEDLRDKLES